MCLPPPLLVLSHLNAKSGVVELAAPSIVCIIVVIITSQHPSLPPSSAHCIPAYPPPPPAGLGFVFCFVVINPVVSQQIDFWLFCFILPILPPPPCRFGARSKKSGVHSSLSPLPFALLLKKWGVGVLIYTILQWLSYGPEKDRISR